ncbi:hypothetical protein [Dyella subtropica]|uniref:hypothetical protein n=1 Tax=Dyella subtropica TaxID=2992127 RepID=UPI002250202D|nr:hypothetical protein [Dyella subtropica]
MSSDAPDEATIAALAATRSFVTILRDEGLTSWAKKFEAIAASLESELTQEALHLFSMTKYTGPGSLSDVYARDEKVFYAAWGACSRALGELRRFTAIRANGDGY